MADDAAPPGPGAETITAPPVDTSGGAPEWLGALPDDLKADATLTRYADVEALARGHVEAHRVAKSKLAIPGEFANDEDWAKVYDALGRPKEPGGYELPLPALADDADDAAKAAREATAKAYQDLFHQVGLNPRQASALVAADLARIDAAQSAFYAKGEQEVAALKAELGADYAAQVEAAKDVFKKLGFEPGFADELDTKVGSAALLRGFIKLAKVAGEHVRVHGGGGDFNASQDPQAELKAKFRDESWRAKFNAGDVATVAEHDRLHKAAQAAATRPSG
jgi:hypothetical protein